MKKKMMHIFRCFLTLISPRLNTEICYLVKFKKKLPLKNPMTLNEKLLWLKLNDYPTNDLVKKCADKYAVRDYIRQCGCEEILNNLIATYDRPEEIAWDQLPHCFAIKWNYGCGLNYICNDKSKIDYNKVTDLLKKMGKKNAYLPYSEIQYKNVRKKIIVEKYLGNDEGVFTS